MLDPSSQNGKEINKTTYKYIAEQKRKSENINRFLVFLDLHLYNTPLILSLVPILELTYIQRWSKHKNEVCLLYSRWFRMKFEWRRIRLTSMIMSIPKKKKIICMKIGHLFVFGLLIINIDKAKLDYGVERYVNNQQKTSFCQVLSSLTSQCVFMQLKAFDWSLTYPISVWIPRREIKSLTI